MKVYRGFDGKLRLFRPDLNAARLNMSSTRVSLPAFNEVEFVKLLKALMKVDGPSKHFLRSTHIFKTDVCEQNGCQSRDQESSCISAQLSLVMEMKLV